MHAWDDVAPMEAPFLYRLARRLEEYMRLMRLNRPIGIWLLLWPTLWALWVAGNGHPDPKVLVVFVLGVTVMRSAGCIINDFADRNVDPHVRRTRERPLAARRVTPTEALLLFVGLLGVALWLATFLNPFTLRLACVGAALTVSYPSVSYTHLDVYKRQLYPQRYRVLERALKRARGNQKEFLQKIERQLQAALLKNHSAARVERREKHLYSIYKKMRRKRALLRDVYKRQLLRSVSGVRHRRAALALEAAHALVMHRWLRQGSCARIPKSREPDS